MNTSEETVILFNLYLRGEMTSEERSQFESKLSSDPKFHASFLLHQEVVESIENYTLKAKMQEWHPDSTPQPKNYSIWIKPAIGALILLGLYVIFNLIKPQKVSESPTLFTKYYYADPGLPITMGNSNLLSLEKGMQAYKLGDYDAALDEWNVLVASGIGNDTVKYYVGSAYLALDEQSTAIHWFEQVPRFSIYYEKALWYILLAQLKDENMEAAMRTHKMLLSTDPKFHKKELNELKDFLDLNE